MMSRLLAPCRRRRAGGVGGDHSFGLLLGAAFTVNYIMGCGFLGIPSAFVKSGVILGPLLVIAFGFVMNVTKDYMCEVTGRAEALSQAAVIAARGAEEQPSAQNEDVVPRDADYLVSSTRKFEVTDQFALFMGRKARTVYVIILCGYLYGALWAYSSVFASSFSANVPVFFLNNGQTCNVETEAAACNGNYHLWLAVFAVLAVPLACTELKEQVFVQVIMFAARILVVLLLSGTVFAGWSCKDGVVFAELPPDHKSNAPWFRASGLGDLIPVCIYAFIFHHSVPILAQPLRNKYTIRSVFAVAFGITCVSYVSIGFFVAYFFGSDINAQCNLNWRSYVGCMHPPAVYGNATLPGAPCSSAASWGPTCVSVSDRPASASIISFIVLIFPALDVLSAFPLNAITLGNNLMSACLGEAAVQPPAVDADTESERAALLLGATDADVDSSSSSSASGSPGKAGKASLSSARSMCATHRVQRMLRTRRGHRLITVCFRLVAAVPAVVGAAFVSNLDNILQFTGLIGIAIAFLIPAVLRVFALAKTRAVFAHVSSVVAPASTAASVANTLPSTRTLAARRAVDDTDALESAPVASAVEAAEKAVLEAVRSTNITWREALMHTGGDKLFETPYSTWFGRGRIPEALFVASVGVAIYVFVVVVHHAATGSS